jgi:Peptidase M15
MSANPQQKLSPKDFAARIRSKHPGAYDDVPDDQLTRRTLSRYPAYTDMVDLPDLDKPLDAETVSKEAHKYGLATTSGKRSAERNRAVGGAKHSYHLTGNAFDFAGPADKMKAFYDYMRDTYGGRMKEILHGTGDHRDHVHVAFGSEPSAPPAKAVPAKLPAVKAPAGKDTANRTKELDAQLADLSRKRQQFIQMGITDHLELAPIDKAIHDAEAERYKYQHGQLEALPPALVKETQHRAGLIGANEQARREEKEAQPSAFKTVSHAAEKSLEQATRPFAVASTAVAGLQRQVGDIINGNPGGGHDWKSLYEAVRRKAATGEDTPGYEQPVAELYRLAHEHYGGNANDAVFQLAHATLGAITDPVQYGAVEAVGRGVKGAFRKPASAAETAAGQARAVIAEAGKKQVFKETQPEAPFKPGETVYDRRGNPVEVIGNVGKKNVRVKTAVGTTEGPTWLFSRKAPVAVVSDVPAGAKNVTPKKPATREAQNAEAVRSPETQVRQTAGGGNLRRQGGEQESAVTTGQAAEKPVGKALLTDDEVKRTARSLGLPESEIQAAAQMSRAELETALKDTMREYDRALRAGKTAGEIFDAGLDTKSGLYKNLLERAGRRPEGAKAEAPLTRAGLTVPTATVDPLTALETARPAGVGEKPAAERQYGLSHRASEPAPDGGTTHLYDVKTPQGDTNMTVSISPDGRTAEIDWVGETGQKGDLGVKGVRGMLRELQREHPELEQVKGVRVSGVRGERPEGVTVNLKRQGGAENRLLDEGPPGALADRRFEMPAGEREQVQQAAEKFTAESPARFGVANKLVTQTEYADAVARLKAKLSGSTLRSGLDPELIADAARVGAYYLEAGARSFAAWSAKMADDLGDEIKPHLAEIWSAARAHLERAKSAPPGQKERSLPKTLEEHGIVGGEDRSYKPITNRATLEAAEQTISQRGVEGTLEWLKSAETPTAEHTATAIRLIDDLQDKAARMVESNPAEADRLMGQATEMAGKLSARLTSFGQAVQAVQVVERLHPARIVETAQRVMDRAHPGRRVPKETATEMVARARELRDANRELAEAKKTGDAGKTEAATKRVTESRKAIARQLESLDRWGRVKRSAGSLVSGLRSIKTSWDVSAPGRQGWVYSVLHPWSGLAKPFARQMKALGGIPDVETRWGRLQKRLGARDYKEMQAELFADPDAQEMIKFGSEMTGVGHDTPMAAREEPFRSNWAEKVPGVARSEQAFSTFLNYQRLQMYKTYKGWLTRFGMTPESHPQEYAGITRFINDGTGRGTLAGSPSLRGRIDPATFSDLVRKGGPEARQSMVRKIEQSPVATQGLFAYRWLKSRVNLLNPAYYVKLPKAARVIALAEMTRFVGTLGLTGYLASKLGAEVSLDPDSADFLKVVVGNTHYDLSGGFQNELRFFFRLLKTAQDRHNGGVVKKGGQWYDKAGNRVPGISDIALDFGRSKLAPVPAAAADYATGEMLDYDEQTGKRKPFSAGNEAVNLFEPMVERDLRDAWQVDRAKGVAKALPSIAGIGVQTYKPKVRRKKAFKR